MSFINKALEKANIVQKQSAGPAPPSPGGNVAPARPMSPPPPLFPEQDTAGTIARETGVICYTNTQNVHVDLSRLAEHRIICGTEYPEVQEEYKLLRAHILQRTKEAGHNTLMITSPHPDCGKSLTAINLAIAISQELDQTALLVDADLRSPSVHHYFDWHYSSGLIDYLKNKVPCIGDILVHPAGLAKLVILPGGQPAPEAAEMIRSPRMAELVLDLKNYYPDRFVLFDVPPLNYADALGFAPLVDGIILVVEAGKTSREDITRCLAMLEKFNVVGLVINKVRQPQSKLKYYEDFQPKISWFRKLINRPRWP